MNVLIVESKPALTRIWAHHLKRQHCTVLVAEDADTAISILADSRIDAIILDVVLEKGNALSVSDYAQYRHPDTPVIFVSSTSFFSDGSIFDICANARAFLPTATPPADIAALVEHYAHPA